MPIDRGVVARHVRALISAGEVEMAVLKEIGADLRMVSREQTAKVKEVLDPSHTMQSNVR